MGQLRGIQRQVAAAPADQRAQAQAQAADQIKRLWLASGIQGIPQIDSKPFISQIVFDATRGADVPKARFAALFPSRDAALIQLRLRPDLTAAQRTRAIELIHEATAMPLFRLRRGGPYTVSRRAGRHRRARRQRHRRDRRPADRRRRRDGARTPAAVQGPPAPAAAADRARRRRADVRRDGARRRRPHDGRRRRPAGADRPRRRLRDPVPVARRGAASEGHRGESRGAGSHTRGRAHHRHRRPRHRRRLPRPAALADPDGPRLRASARHRDRYRVRHGAHRGLRRARSEASAGAR